VCSPPRLEILADGVKPSYVAAMWDALAELLGLGSWAILDRLGPRGRSVAAALIVALCALATIGFVVALLMLLV